MAGTRLRGRFARVPITDHLVHTHRSAIRLNTAGAHAKTRELDRQRLLQEVIHQERRDAWRVARNQALLGLARHERDNLVAMEPEALHPLRRVAHTALLA